ncbi:MAG TPA: hypothetical protein VGF67_09590 [Ktedonobacteraceae bacterium]|jgi:hypothetical protein
MEDQYSLESVEDLLTSEFTQGQIEQLTRLRTFYVERAQKQKQEERHRLEFARWLVAHGRLTDELPTRRYKRIQPHHFYSGNGEG